MVRAIGLSRATAEQECAEINVLAALREIPDNAIGKTLGRSDQAGLIGILNRLITIKGTRVYVCMTLTEFGDKEWTTHLSTMGPRKLGELSSTTSVHGKGLFNAMLGISGTYRSNMYAIRLVASAESPFGWVIEVQRIGVHADEVLKSKKETDQRGCIDGKLHIFPDNRGAAAKFPFTASFDDENKHNPATVEEYKQQVLLTCAQDTNWMLLGYSPWEPGADQMQPLDLCDDFLGFVQNTVNCMAKKMQLSMGEKSVRPSMERMKQSNAVIYVIWPVRPEVQLTEAGTLTVDDKPLHTTFANSYLPSVAPTRQVFRDQGLAQGQPAKTLTTFGDKFVDWDSHWIQQAVLKGKLVPYTAGGGVGPEGRVHVHDGFFLEAYYTPLHLLPETPDPAYVLPHLPGSLALGQGTKPIFGTGQLFMNAPTIAICEASLTEVHRLMTNSGMDQNMGSRKHLFAAFPEGHELAPEEITRLEKSMKFLRELKKKVGDNEAGWVRNQREADNKWAGNQVDPLTKDNSATWHAQDYLRFLCMDMGTKVVYDGAKRMEYGLTGKGITVVVTFTSDPSVDKNKTVMLGDHPIHLALVAAILRTYINIYNARVRELGALLEVNSERALAEAEARKQEEARRKQRELEKEVLDKAKKKEEAKRAQKKQEEAEKKQRMRDLGVYPELTMKTKVQFYKGRQAWLIMKAIEPVQEALQEGRLRLPTTGDGPTLFKFKGRSDVACNAKLFTTDGKIGAEIVAADNQDPVANEFKIDLKPVPPDKTQPLKPSLLCAKQISLAVADKDDEEFTFVYYTAASGKMAYTPDVTDRAHFPLMRTFAQAVDLLPQSFQACFGPFGALRVHRPAGQDPISAMLRIKPVFFKPKSTAKEQALQPPINEVCDGVQLLTIYPEPLRDAAYKIPSDVPATEALGWLAQKIVYEALRLYKMHMKFSDSIKQVLLGNILANRSGITATTTASSNSARKRPAQSASAPANPPPPPSQRARTDGGSGGAASSSSAGLPRTPAGIAVEEMD